MHFLFEKQWLVLFSGAINLIEREAGLFRFSFLLIYIDVCIYYNDMYDKEQCTLSLRTSSIDMYLVYQLEADSIILE